MDENLSFFKCNRDFWGLDDVKKIYASKRVDIEEQQSSQSTLKLVDEDDINSLHDKYDIPMEFEEVHNRRKFYIDDLKDKYNDADDAVDYGEDLKDYDEFMSEVEWKNIMKVNRQIIQKNRNSNSVIK